MLIMCISCRKMNAETFESLNSITDAGQRCGRCRTRICRDCKVDITENVSRFDEYYLEKVPALNKVRCYACYHRVQDASMMPWNDYCHICYTSFQREKCSSVGHPVNDFLPKLVGHPCAKCTKPTCTNCYDTEGNCDTCRDRFRHGRSPFGCSICGFLFDKVYQWESSGVTFRFEPKQAICTNCKEIVCQTAPHAKRLGEQEIPLSFNACYDAKDSVCMKCHVKKVYIRRERSNYYKKMAKLHNNDDADDWGQDQRQIHHLSWVCR